jgi:rubrerythrin
MTAARSIGPRHAAWSLDDIPYDEIDKALVRGDEYLFYTLASASFIEITSDLYTGNLIEHFRDDPEAVDWLEKRWQHEEVQHGVALRRYVETVWPEFPWIEAYRRFFDEYARLCSVEYLAPSHALEFASRCVVETGTATFYRMISEAAPEPVLRKLTANISSDEVRHYKYFFKFFRRYRDREHPSQIKVAWTLLHRAIEIDTEDGFIAFKHVYLTRHPEREFRPSIYREFRGRTWSTARSHYPFGMAVKMLLKPLNLSVPAGRIAGPFLTKMARRGSPH